MSEYRVGGAYVDLYLKGLDEYNAEIDKASNKIVEYATRLSELNKKKAELQATLKGVLATKGGSKTDEAAKLKKEIKDITLEEKKLKVSYKETSEEISIQAKKVMELGKVLKENQKVSKQNNQLMQYEEGAKAVSKSVNTLRADFASLKGVVSAFRAVLASLAVKEMYEFLIEPNAQIEQYIVNFTTLLGSLEEAQNIMDDIITIAKKTPFETEDVTDAIETLSQYGVAQENLIPIFNQLADLSRGNAENLNNIALAYGRIKNSGKITLQQLNIMIRRGVPIMQAFADVTGKTTGELYKMIRNGELAVEVFDEAINYLTKDGGRFEGLVEEQSKTFLGRLSTLKDDITFIGKDIGESTFGNLSEYLEDLILTIERLDESGELKEFTDNFGEGIADAIEDIGDFTKMIIENKDEVLLLVEGLIAVTAGIKAFSLNASKLKAGGAIVGSAALFSNLITGAAAFLGVSVVDFLVKFKKGSSDARQVLQDIAFKDLTAIQDGIDNINKKFSNEFKSLQSTDKEVKSIIKNLSDLNKVENKTPEQIAAMKEDVADLNNIFQDLGLTIDELGNLNFDIESLELFTDETIRQDAVKSIEDYVEKLKDEREELKQNIEANEAKKKLYEESLGTWDNALEERYAQETIDLLTQSIAEGNVELGILNKEIALYENHADNLGALEINTEDLLVATDNIETVKSDLDELYTRVTNVGKQLGDNSSEYVIAINKEIGAVDELTETMMKNASEQSFTSDEMMKLIGTYPELMNSIYETADGYKFEKGALENLRIAKLKAAHEAISGEIDKTALLISQTEARIQEMGLEEEAAKQLMLQLEALRKEQAYNEEAKQVYEKQLELALSEKGRETYTPKKSSGESYDEKLIRNLKFKYDMGIIDAENYYNELEKIKDKYYKDGSKKWQQYTLEVKRGREKIEEEQKKAAEAEFKNTIAGMRERIEDAEFYETKSKDEIIKDLNDIRQYILKSYLDRKIDYENFAEQLREIDKDIYSQEKELLEENIDEMNELRNKKYDEAVKKINDYYEAIERAQKNAEREQELRELRETAELYEGAVSRAGQQKLKELQSDIRELEKEKLQDKLENQREFHLENLDAKYQALEENQNEYFSTVQNGIKTTAQIVEEYTKQINTFFAQVNGVMKIQRALNEPIVNNLTLNQNITDASSNRAAIDITKIISSYGFK